jgi:hypothetical protein
MRANALGQKAIDYVKLFEGIPFRAPPPPLVADVERDRPVRQPNAGGAGRAAPRRGSGRVGRGRGRDFPAVIDMAVDPAPPVADGFPKPMNCVYVHIKVFS